jgi:hypothetical protein
MGAERHISWELAAPREANMARAVMMAVNCILNEGWFGGWN